MLDNVPRLSLGVNTLNSSQHGLIEDETEMQPSQCSSYSVANIILNSAHLHFRFDIPSQLVACMKFIIMMCVQKAWDKEECSLIKTVK